MNFELINTIYKFVFKIGFAYLETFVELFFSYFNEDQKIFIDIMFQKM